MSLLEGRAGGFLVTRLRLSCSQMRQGVDPGCANGQGVDLGQGFLDAASLGQLLRAGIPVPSGFVVTVNAFDRALAGLDPAGGIRREIGRLAAGDDAADARWVAAGEVTALPLTSGLADALRSWGVLGGD